MYKENKSEIIARARTIRRIRRERIKKEIEELNKVSNRSTKSKILNTLFIIAVFVGLIIYMINEDGIENLLGILANANYKWIIVRAFLLNYRKYFGSICSSYAIKKH